MANTGPRPRAHAPPAGNHHRRSSLTRCPRHRTAAPPPATPPAPAPPAQPPPTPSLSSNSAPPGQAAQRPRFTPTRRQENFRRSCPTRVNSLRSTPPPGQRSPAQIRHGNNPPVMLDAGQRGRGLRGPPAGSHFRRSCDTRGQDPGYRRPQQAGQLSPVRIIQLHTPPAGRSAKPRGQRKSPRSFHRRGSGRRGPSFGQGFSRRGPRSSRSGRPGRTTGTPGCPCPSSDPSGAA